MKTISTALTELVLLLALQLGFAATSSVLAAEAGIMRPGDAGPVTSARVRLVPRHETTLSSRMQGHIEAFHVDVGDSFQAGDILARLDCQAAQARLQTAEAQLRIAEKTHETQRQLKAFSAVSELELEIAAAEADRARGAVALEQARVERCTITAPYDGRVVKLRANVYENAAYGTALLDIIDLGPLRFELALPSSSLSWLEPGQSFDVTVEETGQVYRATVNMIGVQVDPETSTIAIRAAIEGEQDRLLPGMSGTVYYRQAE